MVQPMPPVPEPATTARGHDPLAIALANASLLSIGYLMLGRRRLAAGSGLITLVLVVLVATVARSVAFEVAVVLCALRAGFDTLGSVLAQLPGHEKMVEVAMDAFLDRLPTADPCPAAARAARLRSPTTTRAARRRRTSTSTPRTPTYGPASSR